MDASQSTLLHWAEAPGPSERKCTDRMPQKLWATTLLLNMLLPQALPPIISAGCLRTSPVSQPYHLAFPLWGVWGTLECWKAQNHLYYPLGKPAHECLTQLGTFAPFLRGWEVPGISPQHFWKHSSVLWIDLGPILCGFWGKLLTEIWNVPSLCYWD